MTETDTQNKKFPDFLMENFEACNWKQEYYQRWSDNSMQQDATSDNS